MGTGMTRRAFLTTGGGAAVVLAGAGAWPRAAGGADAVNWMFWPLFRMDPITQDLQAWSKQSGVDVSPRILGYEQIFDKSMLEFEAKSGAYDLQIVNDDWMMQFLPHLAYLESHLTNPKNFIKPALEMPTLTGPYEALARAAGVPEAIGHTIMAPFSADAMQLFWRKDLFDKEGLKPPRTWSELVDAAKALTKDLDRDGKPDQWGVVMPNIKWLSGMNYATFFGQVSGKQAYFDKALKPVFNTAEGVQALTFIVDLFNKHKVVPPGALAYHFKESRELMSTGKAAMCFDYPGLIGALQDPKKSLIVDKFEVALCPTPKHNIAYGGLWSWGIPKYSKRQAAAGKLLDFLLSDDVLTKLVADQGYGVPARKTAADRLLREKRGVYARWATEIVQAVDTMFTITPIPEWPQFMNTLGDEIHEAILQRKSPEQALKDADRRTQTLLAKYYK